MNWKCHIDHIVTKLSTAGFVIRHLFYVLNLETLWMAYFAYFIQLWDMELYFVAIQLIVIRFSNCKEGVKRIMPGAEPSASWRGLFRRLKILPPPCQYILPFMLFIIDNSNNFQKFMDHIQKVELNCSFQIQTSQVLKNVIKLLFWGKMIKIHFYIFNVYIFCRHCVVDGSLTLCEVRCTRQK